MSIHANTRPLRAVAAAAMLLPLPIFSQGPLDPPGPPAPTMKSLEELEPRRNVQATPPPPGVDAANADYHFIINQPGSYYLSGNLEVTKANGIQINAAGVTLDLNGFRISRASGVEGNGIDIRYPSHNATVHSGTITGFASGVRSAIDLDALAAVENCSIRNLAVSGCATGINLQGTGFIIDSCRAEGNTAGGIVVGNGSTLKNCTASGNQGAAAINAGTGSTVIGCAAFDNTTSSGIAVGFGVTVTDCTAMGNTGIAGFTASGRSSFINCTAAQNRSHLNPGTSDTGMGFTVGFRSTVSGCTASQNTGHGIRVTSNCRVVDNQSTHSGGAGIHATGGGNRIEANNATNNAIGIELPLGGNFVVKNSARGNTADDYEIAAGNSHGPIVDVAGVGDISATANSNHPWANFAY